MTLKLESFFYISIFCISVLCLVTESYSALLSHPDSRRGTLVRTLNPIQRDLRNEERALSTDLLLPRSSVVFNYGYDAIDPAKVSVLVQAHQDRPILLLETLDGALIQSVACQSALIASPTISMTLHSEEVAHAAVRAWAVDNNTTFNVITSHFGCNAANERAAWSVSSVKIQGQTVVLFVSSLPLRKVGETFEVSFRHTGLSGNWEARSRPQEHRMAATLGSRDVEDTLNPTYDEDLSGTEIFPGNASLALAGDIIQQLTDSSLEIICADCASHFNFTIGVDFIFSGLDVSTAEIFAIVNNFNQSVVLDIKVEQELQADWEFDLLEFPVGGWDIPGLFSIGPSIGLSVQFNLSIAQAVDFTIGAKASIPPGASASIDLLNPSSAQATGWDGVSFEKVPLRVNSGTPDLTIGASLAPFIEFDISVGSDDVGLEARLTQSTPSLEFSFASSANVNSACEPVGDNDFAFFNDAYKLDANMRLVTSASVQVNDDGLLSIIGLDAAPSWNATLFVHELSWLDDTPESSQQNCFVLADDQPDATNGPATPSTSQNPSPTGTLLAAASAIPTYNMSKIEAYYDAHDNVFPPGISYELLVESAQQVPDGLKPQTPSATLDSSGNPVQTGSAGGSRAASSASRSYIRSGMDIYFVAFICVLASVSALI